MKKKILFILLVVLFINGCSSVSEVNEEKYREKEPEDESEESEDLNSVYYELACEAIDKKQYLSALSYLYECNNYLDADSKINELKVIIDESRTGKSCFVSRVNQILAYIDQNSNLQLIGKGKGKYDINIDEWTDLKSIDVSCDFIIGVKNDGTVLMAALIGETPKVDVSDWTDISDIVIVDVSDTLIVGLKNDGTVIYARSEDHNSYMEEHPYLEEIYPEKTEEWNNIKRICAQNTLGIFGITEEGKIVCTKESLLTKVKDVNVFDVGAFGIAFGEEGAEVIGIYGAWPYIPSPEGMIDVVVGDEFVAYLFENGEIVIGNTEACEVELTEIDLDNIVAISLANSSEGHSDLLAAYGIDGSIHLIGNTDSLPKEINLSNTPINIVPVEFIKEGESTEVSKEEQKKEPELGMTQEEVLKSTWGEPVKKNITESVAADGVKHISEQWVYSDDKYLYFDDGILITIQRSE